MKKILSNELIRRLDYSEEGSKAVASASTTVSIDPGFRNLMSEIVSKDEQRRAEFKKTLKK